MKADNATVCLTQLTRILNIPVTGKSIQEELSRHPDYPSFLALSDVLSHWGIPNGAYQVESKEISTIPTPFIAQLSSNGGEFVLVKNFNEAYVKVSNERWHNHKLAPEEFYGSYTGFILMAELAAGAGEQNYIEKRRKEIVEAVRVPLLISGIVVLAAVLLTRSSYFEVINWHMALLTFAKSAGLLISVLLLVQSIDADNPLIQRLCSGDKNSNCNAILSSKAAKITDELSWSEVGFFYFAGTWLFLLLGVGSTASTQALAVLNLLCLPYTLYSVYYQYRVARQWCLLCCIVQALLWMEFVSLLPFLRQPLDLPTGEWVMLLATIMTPILLWSFIKPYLLKAQQLEPLRKQLNVFKYNSDMFQKILSEQQFYQHPDEMHSVVLGNKEAKKIITMVSNPYCAPCSKAHQILESWLTRRDDLQLRVVFSTNENLQDPTNIVAQHLMSLNRQNEGLVKQALSSWYTQEQKDYEPWAKLHPVSEQQADDSTLEKQREWCRMAQVEFTPTILINGRRLAQLYSLEDAKYFI